MQTGVKTWSLWVPTLLFAVGAGAGGADEARAGGLVVPGAGPSAQPRAGAFVASADDPTTLGHNPAGFAKLDGTQISIGANFIDFSLTYQRFGGYEVSDDTEPGDYEGSPFPVVKDKSKPDIGIGPFQMLPIIAFSTDLGRPEWPIRIGGGLFTPQGYTAREFDEQVAIDGATEMAPGPQRYDSIEQTAVVIQPSLAVAYRIFDSLDVGVRASWGYGRLEGKKAVWGVRNYDESRGQDSLFTLDGATDKFIPGFSLGVLYRPTPWLELGGAYNSPLSMQAKGSGSSEVGEGILDGVGTEPVPDAEAQCAPGGVEGALKICFDLTIAQSATAGARWILRNGDGTERADLEINLRWEDWSESKDNTIIVDGREKLTGAKLNEGLSRHGFRDAVSVRLGGAYHIPLGSTRLSLRAGAAYDTAAAPDSWTRVDLDGKSRVTLGAGVGVAFDRYEIKIGGGAVIQPDVEVAQCKGPGGPDVTDPGCAAAGGEVPAKERTRPDPQQPLQGKFNQVESPFNAGRYESGYRLFSIGVTTRF